MGQPAPDRWWRRGRDQAQAAAREASGRAAQALIELDRVQTEAADGVRMLAAVDGGRALQQAEAAWQPVSEQANQAVAAYMSAVSAADLDSDPEEPVARHATEAFRASADQLGHAVVAIRRFLERTGPQLQHARNAHAVVPDRVYAAKVAVTAAADAVDRARAQGFRAREATALLEQARQALSRLDAGMAALGLQRMLDNAARASQLAEQARVDAESLGGRAEAIATRITSVRTFLQAATSQLDAVPATLSELRRSYVYPSFADLEELASTASGGLGQAHSDLDRAAALARPEEQRWGEAEQAIRSARTTIEAATHAARAVRERLVALRDVEQDPAEPLRQARRVVRDAQRFLLAGTENPSPQHVSRLDALGAQLDTAPDRLAARNRPDYWAYLTELRTVTEGARAVVDAVRQSRAPA